jgi:urease accessory protein
MVPATPMLMAVPITPTEPGKSDATAAGSVAASAVLRLLQLTSPALPIGAFAYSQGLEMALERGWVSDEHTTLEWLRGLLSHSIGQSDLPLLAAAWDAWNEGDDARANRLAELGLALRESGELRAEDRHLGKALARLLGGLGVERAATLVDSRAASYLSLFALAGVSWGIDKQSTLLGFSFGWLESQVSAASRLLPLGQLAAQRTLSQLLTDVPLVVERALLIAAEAAGNSAPGLGMASAWHEEQYSRLFRS